MKASARVCSGKDCGKPPAYSVHVVSSDGRFFYCEQCRGEFTASLKNVPEDRREALLKEIVIIPMEVEA
jgi:hypothetical protein